MRTRFGLLCWLFLGISSCAGKSRETPSPSATTAVPTDAGSADSAPNTDSDAEAGAADGAPAATCDLDSPAVVGCGCPQEPVPPPEVWSCVACPDLAKTSAVVGPAGGSIILRGSQPTSFKLTILPDALAVATRIGISASIRPPSSFDRASAGYLIEPRGLAFLRPVSITIPLLHAHAGTALYFSPDTCSKPTRATDSVATADSVSAAVSQSGVVFASSGPNPSAD